MKFRWFRGATRPWLLLCLASVLPGCLTADRILRRADFARVGERDDNAEWAAEIAADGEEDERLRAHAIDVLGILRAGTPVAIDALGRVVTGGGSDDLRARAAWALGEIGRELPWNTLGVRLHQYLLRAAGATFSPAAAYFISEAIAKEYVGKEHSPDEDLATVEALTAMAADQIRELPSVYYAVFQKIASTEILIELAGRNLGALADGVTQEELTEAYAAAFNVLRRVHDDRAVLLESIDQRRELVRQAFATAMDGLKYNVRILSMMLVWYAGVIGVNAPMAELLAEHVASVARHDDVLVRHLTAWSLARMQLYARAARTAMRDQVLRTESDIDVLRILMAMHLEPGSMDLIQRAYGVEPPAAGGSR
ncbi:MAG: hypothetical protein QME96_12150 [Myxococcota bacterium]|nr:hypothetical protein [Myxococcota bacterium]